MTKQEFNEHLAGFLPEGSPLPCFTNEEWMAIDKVYVYHPAISDTDGKAQIAELYARFGMSVIMDMVPRADLMARKEEQFRRVRASLDRLREDMDHIRNGGWIDEDS